jgi:hypothetical protein
MNRSQVGGIIMLVGTVPDFFHPSTLLQEMTRDPATHRDYPSRSWR